MSGMSGGSMLRTRRKDVNIKPNRRLDRKSSRGMLYENEELRLRTININAEVERGQSDIKKLKRENEQLRREVGALRGEYDRLEKLLKSRHLEDMSDHEGSESCCSDCESDCCNVQNDMNDMKIDLPQTCKANTITNVGFDGCKDVKNEEEGFDLLMNNLGQCGTLSVVPEEASSRMTSPEPKERDDVMNAFTMNDESDSNPKQEYYRAVVTLPLDDKEESEMPSISIFPKSGLDVLMNNNTYEDFQGYRSSPPIGFIIPQQPKNNCQIVSTSHNYKILSDQNNQDLDGGSIEDFLKYIDPIMRNSNQDSKKDSYIICNTRKIIQQLTLHTPLQNDPNPTIIIPSDAPIQSIPSYKTEKNIELDYDYPQPFRSEQRINLEPICFDIKNEVPHATQTTTEIKNTFLMFERNSIRNRPHMFMRSQSEPVEILTDEPVYATVNKLPKKVKRLHINKLENEIKYIPSEDAVDNKEVPKPPKLTIQIPSILKNSDLETLELDDSKINEEHKFEGHTTNNIIPKSPIEIKKKRFSIHFKRKSNKKVTPPKTSDETTDDKVEPKLSNSKSDSDRLLEQSSSLDSGDVESSVKLRDNSCKKHRHAKQTHIPARCRFCPNCDCHKVHHCEKCSTKRSSVKDNDHGKKRNSVPGFKIPYDSYQEMTTSHSERERTNSLSSSGHSGLSLNMGKPRVSREDSIPWCGCWGNSCL